MAFIKALLIYKPFDDTVVADSSSGTGWSTDTDPDPDTADTRMSTDVESEEETTWGLMDWTAVIKEGHSVSNEVTSFPVGTGFNVSNHVIKKNRILQLHGVVSNVTMGKALFDPLTAIPEVGGAILGTGAGAALASALNLARNFITGQESDSPIQKAFITLQRLCQEGRFVHVTTILGPYVNCVIRSVECEQDEATSTILSVKLVIEELQVVGLTRDDAEILTYLEDRSQSTFEWDKYVNALGLNVLGLAL